VTHIRVVRKNGDTHTTKEKRMSQTNNALPSMSYAEDRDPALPSMSYAEDRDPALPSMSYAEDRDPALAR
jgi:hypothetical protein